MRLAPPTEEWARQVLAERTGNVVVTDAAVRLTAHVKGHVQGVGYRWWTRSRALELGLAGTATNLADGRVEVVAEGPEQACRALLALLPTGPGRVAFVAERWSPARGSLAGFEER